MISRSMRQSKLLTNIPKTRKSYEFSKTGKSHEFPGGRISKPCIVIDLQSKPLTYLLNCTHTISMAMRKVANDQREQNN